MLSSQHLINNIKNMLLYRETGQETKATFNSLEMLLGKYKESRDLTGSELDEFKKILHSGK